jgi:voltage-gated potassium channel
MSGIGAAPGSDMASDLDLELPPRLRRRLAYRAVLRALLNTTALVVVYYLLPAKSWNGAAVLRVLAGMLAFACITVWQVRSIAGSRYPGVKAAEALGLIFPLYLMIFASTYFMMGQVSVAAFTEPLTKTDALYFTVTVFSTVGFGDIAPVSESARVVLILQMLGDLALLGAGVRILLGAVRRGRERRADAGSDSGPAR